MLRNSKTILKTLKDIKKKQDLINKQLEKMEENQNVLMDAAADAATPNDKSWLAKFVDDCDLEAIGAIGGATATISGGIGLTSYVLDQNLSDEQKVELVRKTKTDYVTIEHLENNNLMTDFYQNSDQISLFHTEKTKKPWYKFW